MRTRHASYVVLSLLLLAASWLLHAEETSLEDRIRAVERQRLAAMVTGDVETLDRLLDSCLEYEHSNGTTDSKDSLLESLRSGRVRYVAFEPKELRVELRGPDVAEVTSEARVRVEIPDRALDLDLSYTATWNLIQDEWRLVHYESRNSENS